MTTKNVHIHFINKIPALFWVGVLLVFIANIDLIASARFTFAPLADTTEQIGLSFENTAERMVVIRNAKTKKVDPELSKMYQATNNFSLAKDENNIAKGVTVIFRGSSDMNVEVTGLKSDTEYEVDYYTLLIDKITFEKSYSFMTIAKRPEKNSYNITYRNVTDKEITIAFRSGKGAKHVVALGEFAPVGTPQIGTEYDDDLKFGKGSKFGDNAFAVYVGKDTVLTISNLKPNSLYNFRIYDFNGSSNRTCYNIDSTGGNPSAKRTLLETPKNLTNAVVSDNHFEPKWMKSEGATSYEISVAFDPEFKRPIVEMTGMDVGNIDQFYVDGLKTKTKYYWRVMATTQYNRSLFSKIMEVETK